MVPESALPARPLGQKLPHFFRLAWRLVSEGQPLTRQQVITKVASEGGLHRVKELTDTRFENISDGQQIAVLKEAMIPFFQAISHEDVLSSLLLELFGPSGRRAIRLFTYVTPILRAIKSSSESNVVFAYVEASLAVLQKIVDLNGTALILAEFHPLLQTISDCLGEDITLADNLAMSPAQMVSKNVTDPLVTFEIHQDMPGSLSMEGPRHDNDHKDITDIKIMLTTQEISQQQSKTKPEKHKEWELRSEIDSNSSEIEGLLSDLKRADTWKSVKTYLEANQPHHHDELFGDEEDGFQTELNLRCLQQAHVIGVTTTGLAKNLDILRRLRSKVMLCEEAGEVLEAYTITVLLP
ncbi:MAG: hypothetical protein Q9173_005193 [Seirophora scorigena]